MQIPKEGTWARKEAGRRKRGAGNRKRRVGQRRRAGTTRNEIKSSFYVGAEHPLLLLPFTSQEFLCEEGYDNGPFARGVSFPHHSPPSFFSFPFGKCHASAPAFPGIERKFGSQFEGFWAKGEREAPDFPGYRVKITCINFPSKDTHSHIHTHTHTYAEKCATNMLITCAPSGSLSPKGHAPPPLSTLVTPPFPATIAQFIIAYFAAIKLGRHPFAASVACTYYYLWGIHTHTLTHTDRTYTHA